MTASPCHGCGRPLPNNQGSCQHCGFKPSRGTQGYLNVHGATCASCPWFTDQPFMMGTTASAPPYGCGFVLPHEAKPRRIQDPDNEFCSMHPAIQAEAQRRNKRAMDERLEALRLAREAREASRRKLDL